MRAMDRLLGRLVKLMAMAAALAMLLMMTQVTLDVFLRWLFGRPIPGTLEIVTYFYMVAVIFLPLGLVTYSRDHIVVELFTRGLGARGLAAVTFFGNLLSLLYTLALTWLGAEKAIAMTLVNETWSAGIGDIVIWPSRWFIPLGCVAMSAYFLLHAIDDLACMTTGKRALVQASRREELAE